MSVRWGSQPTRWSAMTTILEEARRAATQHRPGNALDLLATARGDLDATIERTVVAARADGETWQAIGDALGVTRQSAWVKYRGIDPVCGPDAPAWP